MTTVATTTFYTGKRAERIAELNFLVESKLITKADKARAMREEKLHELQLKVNRRVKQARDKREAERLKREAEAAKKRAAAAAAWVAQLLEERKQKAAEKALQAKARREKTKQQVERKARYYGLNKSFRLTQQFGITEYTFGPFGEVNSSGDYTGLDVASDAALSVIRTNLTNALSDWRKTVPSGGFMSVTIIGRKVRTDDGAQFEQRKSFNNQPADDITGFLSNVMNFDAITHTNNAEVLHDEDEATHYSFEMVKLRIKYLKPLAGGCRNREKIMKISGLKLIDHQSRGENNCFFACCKTEFCAKYELSRMSEKFCNEIRAKYDIPADALITIDKAVEIYNGEFEAGLLILNDSVNFLAGSLEAEKKLMLMNEHFLEYVGQIPTVTECPKCGERYLTTHSERACAMRVIYQKKVMAKEPGRYVSLKPKAASTENTFRQVLHYDIETHTKNAEKRHTPYIVGFCWYSPEGDIIYRTMTGDDCMARFYEFLGTDEVKHIKFVNAFKGSVFDHYYLMGQGWKDLDKTTNGSLLMNNGRILKADIHGKTLIDLGNHLTGTLRDNLKAAGCVVQKGDVNHNTTNAWGEMSWELQEEIKIYLEKDVMGLRELYEKINEDMFGSEGVNICDYLTTSHCAYELWRTKYLKEAVYIPTPSEDSFIRQSVYGGRCYKNKHRFVSEQYEGIKNGSVTDIDSVKDFLVYLDVVSLYPTSMMREFPVGSPIKTTEYQEGKMGVYKISYKTNKTLLTPVLPRRQENSLKWDLTDGEGVYTSVDIENAKRSGYTVEVQHGIYWERTAPIFKEYIEKFYQKKQNSVKDTAPYTTAKLYLNGLYGKMIQRPIYTKTFYPKDHAELCSIVTGHIINEMEEVGGRLVVIATPRESHDVEKCVSKPTFCGAFILAYSRWIMMDHINNTNPDNTQENLFYYTDTDSLMTHINSMKTVTTGKNLGDLDNDLGTGKKIIRGYWVAPKLYMLEYCYKDGDKIVIKQKFRGKGLNTSELSADKFETMDQGGSIESVAEYQMKRIHLKRNGNQMDKEVFSVYHIHKTDTKADGSLVLKKDVNRNAWAGRQFLDDGETSVPWGFQFNA